MLSMISFLGSANSLCNVGMAMFCHFKKDIQMF